MECLHQPVMLDEAVSLLITDTDGIYVDGTIGGGGHSEAIAKRLSPEGRLIGFDRDSEILRFSEQRLSRFGRMVTLIHANYATMVDHLVNMGISSVNGILLDLGISSFQLEQSGRGFSFNKDEPLDMRMDPSEKVTASQLINELPIKEIKGLLRTYGEEKRAGMIAAAIEWERIQRPIKSSRHLSDLIRSVVFVSHQAGQKDPATRSFQAIRIAVNKELENLKIFLDIAPSLVASGGRLVILSYHSLEDRIVKQAMTAWEKGCTCPPDFPECVCGGRPLFRRLRKKGLRPSSKEIAVNPRARSAVLRATERIEHGSAH